MKDMYFNDPRGLAFDNERNLLYVADTGNHRIVQLDLESGVAKAVLGTNVCTANDILEGKAALATSICSPKSILVDAGGNLIYLDSTNKMIRKVNFGLGSDGLQRFAAVNANDNSELIRKADGTFLRKFRDTSFNTYSKEGLHLASTDRLGNALGFTYNEGLLEEMIDPMGRVTKFNYNSDLLASIEDPAGRVTSFDYSGRNLASVNYPDGTSQSFSYNGAGLMLQESDKKGALSTYTYNGWGKVAKVKFSDNSSKEFVDGFGSTYASGNYSEATKVPVTNNPNIIDIYKDAKGVETKLTKDSTGEVVKVTDHQNRVTEIERDLKGRIKKITKFDGTYSEFEYNQYGDLISKYDSASDTEESFEYTAMGSLKKHTNTLNQIRQIIYDNKGNAIQEIDPSGNSTFRTYLTNGLVSTIKNDLNEVVTYTHDDFGNTLSVTAPNGEVTNYVRDDAGNILEKANAKGISTLYNFDSFNRLLVVTTGVTSSTPAGDSTSYTYTLNGQLASILDPKNNSTSFEYDSMDRLVKKTSPLGQINQLSYDGNSNVVWEKDPNGNVKTYEYNNDNRLIKRVLPDNLYEITYDDFGNVSSISDSDSALAYTYVQVGNSHLVSSVNSSGSLIEYQYNKIGLKKKTISPYGEFNYGHDSSNRLTSVTNHLGESFGFGYDSSNRLTQINRPGSVTSLAFDKNSFLTSMAHKRGSQVINSFIYTRDAVGNRTSMITARGVASYGYDQESRLTSASNTELTNADQNETFVYDNLGNRLADQSGNFVYDNKSQRLVQDWKYDYYFDLNGNMIKKTERGSTTNFTNYIYSSENQLVRIEEYKNSALIMKSRYFYDALGRRTKKQVENLEDSSKSLVRKFVYDGSEILSELDENNSTLVVYTHSTLKTDDVLAADVRSTSMAPVGSYQYLKDGLGSIIDVTNSSGSKVQHYAYSAFGKLLKIEDENGNDVTANPVIKTPFTYTGREFDEETGLYYYRARYYDTQIGRFLTEDPDPGSLGDPISFNSKYAYVANDPVNLVDPSGLSFSFSKFMKGLGGGMAGLAVGGPILGAIGFAAAYDFDRFKNRVSQIAQSEIFQTAVIIGVGIATGGAGGVILMSALLAANNTRRNGGSFNQIARSLVIGGALGAIGVAIAPASLIGAVATGFAVGFGASALSGGSGRQNMNSGIMGGVTGGVGAGEPGVGTGSSAPASGGSAPQGNAIFIPSPM